MLIMSHLWNFLKTAVIVGTDGRQQAFNANVR